MYDNRKLAIFIKSLKRNGVEKSICDAILDGSEFIKKLKNQEARSQIWFQMMKKMDDLLDEDFRKKIREECACCKKGWRNNDCKQVYKKYNTVEDRINAINQLSSVFGEGVKVLGKDRYRVTFFKDNPNSYKCVCQKMLNKEWSYTWCQCCGGHIKYHLETLLGERLEALLVTTALTSNGKNNCIFELNKESI